MTGTDLIHVPMPATGELVRIDALAEALGIGTDLALNGTPAQQAAMLEALREVEAETARMKRLLTGALAAHVEVIGRRTFTEDGLEISVPKATETYVDPLAFAASLRRAGMPDVEVDTIVKIEVRHKVDLVRAKQAAAANPKYARALKRASTEREKSVSVSVKRRG